MSEKLAASRARTSSNKLFLKTEYPNRVTEKIRALRVRNTTVRAGLFFIALVGGGGLTPRLVGG